MAVKQGATDKPIRIGVVGVGRGQSYMRAAAAAGLHRLRANALGLARALSF